MTVCIQQIIYTYRVLSCSRKHKQRKLQIGNTIHQHKSNPDPKTTADLKINIFSPKKK